MEIRSDLWGIPGTSKVPSPEKELKKLLDKAKREAQHELQEIADDVEGKAKKVLNQGPDAKSATAFTTLARRSRRGSRRRRSRPRTRSRTPSTLWPPKLFTWPSTTSWTRFRRSCSPARSSSSSGGSGSTSTRTRRSTRFRRRRRIRRRANGRSSRWYANWSMMTWLSSGQEVPLLAAFGGKIKVSKIEEAVEFVAHKLGLD